MKRHGLLKLALAAGLIFTVAAFWQLSRDGFGYGKLLGGYNWKYLLVMAVVLLSGLGYLGGLVLAWTPRLDGALTSAGKLQRRLERLGWLNGLGLLLLGLGVPLVVMVWPFSEVFVSLGPRLWFYWSLGLVGALLFKALRPGTPDFEALLASLLTLGVVGELIANLPALSASAFSLTWSEGSRYYNASLYFARQVYATVLPLPTLHPTRYFLQSLAFLIPSASIAFDRLWQVFLWLVCNGLAAWALVRRLRLGDRLWAFLGAAWVFLFLFQGPVYYHLVLCTVPVLVWFDGRRFWRSLGVVLAASLWAGLSRINWYPVPGVLAAALYLLEEPQGRRVFWRYLAAPAAWVLAGTGLAFLANQMYIRLSGNPPEVFGSALSSPLLWYRLWPNSTYGAGLLLAMGVIFLPALVLISLMVLPGWHRWAPIRLLGLAGILAAFLASGIVVSVKIGGGGDLHNMDTFIFFLALVTAYTVFDRLAPEGEQAETARRFTPATPTRAGALAGRTVAVLLLLAAAMPLVTVADTLAPVPPPKAGPARQAEVITILQKLVDQQQSQGPVLFITERQLITFHYLKVTDFEPEYEKVFLMEMVMSGNQAYLERFHDDLLNHRFSMIVTERMNSLIKDRTFQFSEENNLWVEQVEFPIRQSYQLSQQFDDMNFDVYLPH